MVDIDTAIERLEKALGTLREAKGLLNGSDNGYATTPTRLYKRSRRGKNNPITPEEISTFRRMREEGKTLVQISAATGRHPSGISAHLNKAGGLMGS